MTYDLHGQWDYGNKWSDPGCSSGNCLRSDVNLTETLSAVSMITKAGVPSYKVIAGVTSYGRAYQMTTPGCYTESCTFTGPLSGATPGRCTQTAGYISDAEIKEIIATNPSAMDATTLEERLYLYSVFGMGGTSNWAVDLEDFLSAPASGTGTTEWGIFKETVTNGYPGVRTGNWTSLTCTDITITDIDSYTPEERWFELDCADAWAEAIGVWVSIDRPAQGIPFMQSTSAAFRGPEVKAECEDISGHASCDISLVCTDIVGAGTGPAAYEVLNSLFYLHYQLVNFYTSLGTAFQDTQSDWKDFLEDFAPVPPEEDSYLDIQLELLGLGATAIAAPFFNSVLKSSSMFALNPNTLETSKDITIGAIVALVGILQETTGSKGWSITTQDTFMQYIRESFSIWQEATLELGAWLFNGTDEAIQLLGQMIASGKNETVFLTPTEIKDYEQTAFYGYKIPQAWVASGTNVFVLDSGSACDSANPISTQYLSANDAAKVQVCNSNVQYYLVYPEGDAYPCPNEGGQGEGSGGGFPCSEAPFSLPPGVDKLISDSPYDGITVADLVNGSIATFAFLSRGILEAGCLWGEW